MRVLFPFKFNARLQLPLSDIAACFLRMFQQFSYRYFALLVYPGPVAQLCCCALQLLWRRCHESCRTTKCYPPFLSGFAILIVSSTRPSLIFRLCYRLTQIYYIALWPLFHYLLWQDVATEYASADEHWPAYQAANLAFAKRIVEAYRPGDLIWVHDYHLLLVPKLVRQLLPEAIIGLFVHTPFPSSEVFRCLPSESLRSNPFLCFLTDDHRVIGRNEILDGMLGANLVCFQVIDADSMLCYPWADEGIDLLLLPSFHVDMCKSVWIRDQRTRHRRRGTHFCYHALSRGYRC